MEEIGGSQLIPFRPSGRSQEQPSAFGQLIRRGVDEVSRREIGMSPSEVVDGIKQVWDVGKRLVSGSKKSAEPIRKAIESDAPRNMVVASPSNAPAVMAGNAISAKSGYSGAPRITQVHHPAHGPGVRCMGTTVLTPITAAPGSAAAFATAFRKPITPTVLGYGNMLSSVADHYQTYRILALTFRYIPACPTTTGGSLKIAYSADGSEAPFDAMNYLKAAQLPYSFGMAAWEPNAMTIAPVPYNYDQYWLYPAAGGPELRTCWQGQLYGFWNSLRTELAETTLGMLEVDYVVEFWNPCPSQVGAPTLVSLLSEMKLQRMIGQPVSAELKDKLDEHLAAYRGHPDEPEERKTPSASVEPRSSLMQSAALGDKRPGPFRS